MHDFLQRTTRVPGSQRVTRVLVCGGRNFRDVPRLTHILDYYHSIYQFSLLIEGGAAGADRFARQWAERTGIPVLTFKADWDTYGRAAGPIRNRRMLVEGRPDLLIALPGGAGTDNMVRQAMRARVGLLTPGREEFDWTEPEPAQRTGLLKVTRDYTQPKGL